MKTCIATFPHTQADGTSGTAVKIQRVESKEGFKAHLLTYLEGVDADGLRVQEIDDENPYAWVAFFPTSRPHDPEPGRATAPD